MESIIRICALVFICFYAAVRLRYELQMLQQNSYRISRYTRWMRTNATTWSTDTVTNILMAGILFGFHNSRWAVYAVGAVGLVSLYKGVRLLRTKYKKPLVFTARAVRLYAVALLMVAAVVVLLVVFGHIWQAAAAAMLATVVTPFIMMSAVVLLMPLEAAVNRWYVSDARRILAGMPHLTVIGITGSYGKTSTKHYLYRILSERFSVVMTPGSFNTTLGVVRTVREHLKPYTEVFIVEMGAKQPGDIAEICDLVHPSIGILTAVGEQHLESFKTIEKVQSTKFELIDALPPDGTAILNDDFPYIASRPVTNVAQVYRYSAEEHAIGLRYEPAHEAQELAGCADSHSLPLHVADYRVVDVKYGHGETVFAVDTPEGKSEPFTTKLAGKHNLSNLLAGYIAGRVLGMSETEMHYAVSRVEQVEHRLNVKHTPGGVTIIDDAFNSNPHGAAMALEVLSGFTDGRRIVVTPGMIELGEKQYLRNMEFGRLAASSCDLAIIVGEYNREAILAGFAEGKTELEKKDTAATKTDAAVKPGTKTDAETAAKIPEVVCVPTFADASAEVRRMVKAGDTILYENDLPDTFK